MKEIATHSRWIRLWHAFLVLSPSYELAHKCRIGALSGDEVLPADFERVLAVYDDLGPVLFGDFHDWWMRLRFSHFGFGGDERPSIVSLGTLEADSEIGAIGSALLDYHTGQWPQQGQPASLIAAIPTGLPKAQIMKQIAALLDDLLAADDKVGKYGTHNARYALVKKRLHFDSVKTYRNFLHTKGRYPKAPLWRLGMLSGLSGIHGRWLKPQVLRAMEETEDKQQERKQAMKLLASRALRRGHMIAENAARGIFPSYDRCAGAMPLDLERVEQQRLASMTARIQRRGNWQENLSVDERERIETEKAARLEERRLAFRAMRSKK